MDVLTEVKRARQRLIAHECEPEMLEGFEDGALVDAAASIICEQHNYGFGSILWPHDLMFVPSGDWRQAMIEAAALILIDIERRDKKCLKPKSP